ncbi:MAG: type II secretion system inner membrane protein GspF [Desulfobulbaceae bacterium]|jgi:general secretion pathway protein F|nr:type II secretion system inner membrane protein GspF [Desulfobulbaceae bacterium]MDY0350877.1 type II secretion system inner membrane protein GspF [Desulfobulbaceae bacterium]
MPVYEYTALDKAGKKLKGIIDADSQAAARQKIRHAGNYPVDIRESEPASRKKAERMALTLPLFQRVKQQEIHVATRQLATLLGAGIPLVPALNGLIQQTSNQTLKKIIAQLKDSVNEGNSFSSALGEHPALFSKIYVNMVKAGEASGSLDIVLDQLAEFGENQQALKSRVSVALIYPVILSLVGIVILFLLLTLVVPNITEVFAESQEALPLPTIILINVSNFLGRYWWLLALALAGILLAIRFAIQLPKGRRIWDRFKLTFPLLGDLNIRIAGARVGRSLGSLLQSGVPLVTSLKIVQNIFNNVLLAEVIDAATEELEKGGSLSRTLRDSRWFMPMMVQMIAVGEQSGTLESMLFKVADSYEKEVETKIKALTSLIEPFMILFMGVMMLFIVLSILLPIFEMNQLIR